MKLPSLLRLKTKFQNLFFDAEKRRFTFSLLGISLFLFAIIPRPAHAFAWATLAGPLLISMLGSATSLMSTGAGFLFKGAFPGIALAPLKAWVWFWSSVGAILLKLATALMALALDPEVFKIADALPLRTAWAASLAVANLFLVLFIIVIAIGIILRLEQYGTQQMLFRLIIIAVLINFSLVIAQIPIDAANLITTYFLQQAEPGGPAQLGNRFAAVLGSLAGIMDDINDMNLTNIGDNSIQSGLVINNAKVMLAGIVVQTAIATMLVLVGSIAIYLVLRLLYLWGLLILAPIAWTLSVFKDTSGTFTLWWKEFTKWVVYAPVISFLLWMAFLFTDGFEGIVGKGRFVKGVFPFSLLKLVIFLGFLHIANDLAMKVSEGFGKQISTMYSGVSGWTGKQGAGFKEKLTKGVSTESKDWFKSVLPGWFPSTSSAGGGRAATAATGAGGAAAGIVGSGFARPGLAPAQMANRIPPRIRTLDQLSSDDLANILRDKNIMGNTGKLTDAMAAIDILHSRGHLNRANPQDLFRIYGNAQHYGRGEKVESTFPTLAGTEEKVQTAVSQIPEEKIENVAASELGDSAFRADRQGAVIRGLSVPKVNRLLRYASTSHLNNLEKTLKGVLAKAPAESPTRQHASQLLSQLTNIRDQSVATRYDSARPVGQRFFA